MKNQTSTDSDKVSAIFESGLVIDNFVSYSFSSDFKDATDKFSITIEDDNLGGIKKKIRNGERIIFKVNDCIQTTGTIEDLDISCSRSGGTVMTINGRNLLGEVADSYIDPEITITEKDTLEAAIKKVFSPFGISKFEIDDEANRNLIAGAKAGHVDKGKTFKGKANSLKKFISHQTKPNPGEGMYQFAERISKRFGLHIWLSADGETLYVGVPTFAQAPLYSLYRSTQQKNGNNIIDGSARFNWSGQPSLIIAQGHGGGKEFSKSAFKIIMINELTGLVRTDASEGPNPIQNQPLSKVKELVDKYKVKGSKVLDIRTDLIDQIPSTVFGAFPKNCKAFFLFDDESKTPEELEFAVRRKMASFQSTYMTLSYTVSGHSNSTLTPGGAIYGVNTTIDVIDDAIGVQGTYWIKKRIFTKDRSSGTKTQLELILPHSLEF
jgi:prophage tail gpP-like protein